MMKKIGPHTAIVVLLTIGSWVTSFVTLDRLSRPLQRRYFHTDDQPYLLFIWGSFWVLPLLSAIAAGLVAGIVFERGSKRTPLIAGCSLGVACFGGLFEFYASRLVIVISLCAAILGYAAYSVAQLKTGDRRDVF
jgi:hypothetical protein